jgi:acetyl esterase/lipase
MSNLIPPRPLAALAIILVAAGAQRAGAADPAIPDPILLWPNGAPGAAGDSDEDKPAVWAFLPPPEKATGAAILVCPGGAFTTRCTDTEGVLPSRWLNDHGIASFVLRYRIRPLYEGSASNQDAHRAMQYIRANAEKYRIHPDRIGIMGFSAGGELCSRVAFRPVAANPDSADPLDRVSSKVNFMVLIYGTSGMPSDVKATEVPPTFMFCTLEDRGHLTPMLNVYNQMLQARVPVEAHFYQAGEHGTGFALGDPVLGSFTDLMYNWMRQRGFLTTQPRVAIRGIAKLDGEPLIRGMVIFTPVDAAPGTAPVTCYVLNATAGAPIGLFAARQSEGPTPGKYRVEVRQDATRWLSNANTPKLTGEARADFVRKRNLSPSIENQRVYRTKRPGDKEEMIVEIKPGEENRFDIEVFSK